MFKKGCKGYWKGKRFSKEHKDKIKKSCKGIKPSREASGKRVKTRKKNGWFKNPEEHRRRNSQSHKGNTNGFQKGKSPWNKGLPPEKQSGWKGGISFKPYSVDWTKDLKRAIRKRDNYTCQICGKEPAIFIHHIDYNKKNCNLDNLITLCNSCHSKTNFNRKHWIEYFRN